jgi:hypothetical protein
MKKKKTKGKVFVVDIPIWDTFLIISIQQTVKEWREVVRKYSQNFAPDYNPVPEEDDMLVQGKVVIDEYNDPVAIVLSKDPSTDEGAPIMAHEVSHAVQYMLDKRGLTRTKDSEEAYAYTTSFLTKTILQGNK